MLATGWRTVVNGGSVKPVMSESSYPTIETSCGVFKPIVRAARSAPSAMRSEPQMIAVWPRPINAVAAAWPPSTEKSDISTESVKIGRASCRERGEGEGVGGGGGKRGGGG